MSKEIKVKKKRKAHCYIVSYGVVLALYSLFSLPEISTLFFPRPEILPPITWFFKKVYQVSVSGLLFQSIGASLLRMLVGYTLGAGIGISIGLLMGWSRRIDHSLNPLVQLIRPIPALALIPLFILWFGIGEITKVLLIAEGVAFVMLISAYEGMKNVPAVYVEAAHSLRAKKYILIRKVMIPASLSYIISGFRVALATAWAIIIAAEIVASKKGLGYLILIGSHHVDTSLIYVGIIGIGILAYAFDKLVRRIEVAVTGWMEVEKKEK
jgi:ABC-type nitrate/sulfonate/bicarbonate transport system permease component